ncbi:PD40 domain-containing protein [Candidatus Woesearchaeota archaeon]|nr:PD40 domain-containing protein [Candidatus Woesearchaeota archaeon]
MTLTDLVKKFLAASAFSLAMYASGCNSGGESAGCRTDFDCRGDRICHREGYCYDPRNLEDGGSSADVHNVRDAGRDIVSSDSGRDIPRPEGLFGKIAFISYRNRSDRFHIWVMNADGDNPIKVTENVGNNNYFCPSWSPDARKIAYELGGGIYTMNADGSNSVRIAFGQEPAWSPDGQKISYSALRDGARLQDIYLINADGSNEQSITPGLMDAHHPTWSPNGRMIAFQFWKDIWLIDINGNWDNRARLTTSTTYTNYNPVFSPDGRKIVFVSTRDGNNEIYVMNADGGNQINITNNPANDEYPTWSPNGQKIMFTTDRDERRGLNTEIYVMNTDGTGLFNITAVAGNNSNYDEQPAWTR